VAWSRDGGLLASGSEGGEIQIVDEVTGYERVLLGEGRIWSLDFSPDKSQLASAGGDGTIRLWDLSSPDPERCLLKRLRPYITCLAFSPDGRTLLTGHYGGAAELWDVQTGQLAQEISHGDGHTNSTIWSASWSPDGGVLALGRNEYPALLWDARAGRLLPGLPGERGSQYEVAFLPDGNLLATAGKAALRLWETRTWGLVQQYGCITGTLALSPDGHTIALGFDDVFTFNLVAGERRFGGETGGEYVRSLGFSRDGRILIAATRSGTVSEWNLQSPGDGPIERLHSSRHIECGVMTPDGKTMITGGPDANLSFWNIDLCQELFYKHDGRPVRALAISPDGTMLAIATDHDSDLGNVFLWSAPVSPVSSEPK
jgi:WD40 repeat protein